MAEADRYEGPSARHERLIGSLAAGLAPVRRLASPWQRSGWWLLGCAVLTAVLLTVSSTNAIGRLVTGPDDLIAFVGAGLTALLAAAAAFQLAVPGRSAWCALWPLPSSAVWIVASGWGCWVTELTDTGGMVGHPPQACFRFLIIAAIPLSAALLWMLRRSCPVRPTLTATMAGLASAAASAAMLDLVHPFGVTATDLLAHVGGVLVVIGANRLLSGRVLRRWALAVAATVLSHAAQAEPQRLVVVELFTSQGCSSCPPADALLTEYARRRADLLPLAFHVDYWDRLGWVDPFSSSVHTARERQHAEQLGEDTIYTPEIVVDGRQAVVGSDRRAVEAAINAALRRPQTAASVEVHRTASGEIAISVGPGSGAASVLLIGFDPSHRTPIGRGENGGRTLVESNIVRSLRVEAEWTGRPLDLRRPSPNGTRVAVLLETADGRIVGAAAEQVR